MSYLSISSFLVIIYINTFHAFEDTDMGGFGFLSSCFGVTGG